MIPRRIFWLFDAATLGLVFTLTNLVFPLLQRLASLASLSEERRQLPPFWDLTWIYLVMVPVALITLAAMGNHQPILRQSRTRVVVGALLGPIAGLSVISLALFALKAPGWSRLFIFSYVVFSSFGLMSYRLIMRAYYWHRRQLGHYCRNVVLVGSTESIEHIANLFARNVLRTEYALFGYCSIENAQRSPVLSEELPFLGPVQGLGALLVHRPIHDVVLVYPVTDADWVEKTIHDCDYFGVTLRIVPEPLLFTTPVSLKVPYDSQSLLLPSVALVPRDWNSEALFVKRAFDVLTSLVALVALAPVFLIIALVIRFSTPRLPVFYRWRVVGRNGVEFTGYKFTTMISNADQLRDHLQDRNEMKGPVFKIKDDPRITPVGRFLRKYSLNELPQLWSVLKGDMSLVGPRPAFRHELEGYEFWHKRKLSINPGITCLWQVRGRNKINNFDDWVKMDLEYIDNWSLWLDFRILVRTAWVVIAGTGS
jgi:exopolysaccharide biosynthesis polyprenyl glycosylphosphotransferase